MTFSGTLKLRLVPSGNEKPIVRYILAPKWTSHWWANKRTHSFTFRLRWTIWTILQPLTLTNKIGLEQVHWLLDSMLDEKMRYFIFLDLGMRTYELFGSQFFCNSGLRTGKLILDILPTKWQASVVKLGDFVWLFPSRRIAINNDTEKKLFHWRTFRTRSQEGIKKKSIETKGRRRFKSLKKSWHLLCSRQCVN